MRIIHVYHSYAPFSQGGGVERYIHHLASTAVAAGHEVRVVAQRGDAMGLPYPLVIASGSAIVREIATADCVHLHGPRGAYAAWVGLIAWRLRKPYFYTIHCFYRGKNAAQMLQKFLWDHLVERWLMWRSRRVIVLSDYWRTYIAARGLPTRSIIVLPNGVDVATLRAQQPPPLMLVGEPAILSVSRLDPVKRLEDVIAALAQPSLAAAHLHLVGRGEDEARLRTVAASFAVATRVTFHGFQSDAQIAAMARAAHVFVIASAEEGMPTTILEMLARGVPVVASAIPGNLSLTEPLEWDYTYPLGDVAALALCVAQGSKVRVSEAVIAALTARFDWSHIGRAVIALYAEGR